MEEATITGIILFYFDMDEWMVSQTSDENDWQWHHGKIWGSKIIPQV